MRSIPHETALGGVDIPSGSTVVLLFGSANRDPAQFDSPDVVNLTRGSPRRHLAFGHGIHYCVGAALARIEARAVLTTLLERTREFTLDPDDAPRSGGELPGPPPRASSADGHAPLSASLTPSTPFAYPQVVSGPCR